MLLVEHVKKGNSVFGPMSVISSGLRRRSWGTTRPAPAAMLCLTHIKIEFRTLPMPPPLFAQVKTRCGFHFVFAHKDLTASELSGGSSKTSTGRLLSETSVKGLLWRWIVRGLDGLPHWTCAIQSNGRRRMHENLIYTPGQTLWRQIIAIMKGRWRGPGPVVNKCQQQVPNGWWWWCGKDYVGNTSLIQVYK